MNIKAVAFLLTLFSQGSLAADTAAYALVPRAPAKGEVRSITLPVSQPPPTAQAFVAALLDADHYPPASFMGVAALTESHVLQPLTNGSAVVYERSGGWGPIAPRHYVIQLHVVRADDDMVVVSWDLVQHTQAPDGTFAGPFAAALNAHASDTVFTPFNYGEWRLDRKAGQLIYTAHTDAGGALPGWIASDGALAAFPKAFLAGHGWGG